ncbi:type II secretion system F family protein [Halarchaeum salinum]|uniref:Type II secretion system F family protein n=1 Tax=Halarchaeum salinum TaxID=489912 RepID=A0AAV3S638_9EURY
MRDGDDSAERDVDGASESDAAGPVESDVNGPTGSDGDGHSQRDVDGRARAVDGRVRTFVHAHPERFAPLDDLLAGAHVPETVDGYVARLVRRVVLGAGVGLCLGVLVAIVAPVSAFVGTLCVLIGGLLGAVAVGGGSLGRLVQRRARRARAIDGALPHATLFCYTLVHGGTDLYGAFDRLADETEAYGPLAEEVRLAIRDARRFDADVFEALSDARERTPSDDFAVLLDELTSVLETGGDIESFLADAVVDQRERAEHRQERVLDDLETIAEAYIVVALAGPAFLFVVVLVASFTAPGLLRALAVITYVGLPLVLLAFYLVFKRLLARTRRRAAAPVARATGTGATDPSDIDDGPIDDYRRERERTAWRERLAAPLRAVRQRPPLVALVSTPIGILLGVAMFLAGLVPHTLDAMAASPVVSTTGLLVAPFLVATAPFAVLHVHERHRRRDLRARFPDALRVAADAASNGVPLADAISLVAERTSGALATELGRVRRDVAWTDEFDHALRSFADRLRVPDVTRAVGLTVVAVRTTDDVGPVIEAVADDLGTRHEREADRRRVLGVYAGIVVIGVLVYVGMLAAFEIVFLPAISDAAQSAGTLSRNAATPLNLSAVSIETYRTLFYHSALVQAAGNGLVVGALVGGRLRDGIAYAVPLVATVAAAFLAITFLF